MNGRSQVLLLTDALEDLDLSQVMPCLPDPLKARCSGGTRHPRRSRQHEECSDWSDPLQGDKASGTNKSDVESGMPISTKDQDSGVHTGQTGLGS